MPEPKTKPTRRSVESYLDAIGDGERRADGEALAAMMSELSGAPPVMWGTSIVGFGAYEYPLASGKLGVSCRTGFSVRKREISIYLVAAGPKQAQLLSKLGPHAMGKACLKVKRLSDVDRKVLRQLIVDSLSEVARRYGM